MRRSALVLLTGFGLAACATPLDRGTTLYDDRRYVEAEEVFDHTEDQLATKKPSERVHYGVYRGLTLLELGDTAGARHWLAYARDVSRQHPRALNPDDRRALDWGWARIEQEAAPSTTVATGGNGAPATDTKRTLVPQ